MILLNSVWLGLFFLNFIYYFGCEGPSLCTSFSLAVASKGSSLVVVHRLLIAMGSLVVNLGL